MTSYSAYLFDLDGTLIDTKELVIRSIERSLEYAGIQKPRHAFLKYVGLPLQSLYEIFLRESHATHTNAKALMQMNAQYQETIWKDCIKPHEGVKEVLMELQRQGKAMGVVTSRLLSTTEPYLKALNLDQFFEVIVTPEMTQKHKPHPAPIYKACEKMQLDAEEPILFIGDSVFDMLAAQKAAHHLNLHRCFVTWGFGRLFDLDTRPTYHIDSLKGLLSL